MCRLPRVTHPHRLGGAPGRARGRVPLAAGTALAAVAVFASAPPGPQAHQGQAIENFLRRARIVGSTEATDPKRQPVPVTLAVGDVQADAFWITDDDARRLGADPFSSGSPQDTYRAACAAYELDRLLGLGMVPATVERVFSGRRGALVIAIPASITETERAAKALPPPDPAQWERQLRDAHVFDALVYNTDRSPDTILVTPDWQIQLLGFSRAFRPISTLREPDTLTGASPLLLAALQRLTRESVERRLRRFLSTRQVHALLARRDRLVELAGHW
jgi:hypothetical protein